MNESRSDNETRVLVTRAGGFIGHHLTAHLAARGCWVRAVDIKPPEYEPTAANDFEILDLRRRRGCGAGSISGPRILPRCTLK